ncbi:MAG: phage tail tape measure protein [Peptococcaceae bacterium]|nr:MAG: phage tail tape measure protein [Peptococcaceae bacterium]
MPGKNTVEIVLKAIDQASAELKKVEKEIKALSGTTKEASKTTAASGEAAQKAGSGYKKMAEEAKGTGFQLWNLTIVASAAFGAITIGMKEAIQVQQDYKNALLGLESVAQGFGQSTDAAKEAAQRLAADGLMSVADAATGLKNLLAAKFGLPEAVQIMERFKDSAAFGRQASLSFGQAVRSATEGIKNGNSILVDNAGVTKNLSVMLEEAGLSAQDLMRASHDAGVRQAIFNGIMRETQHQVGDAAKLAGTLSGELSKTGVAAREAGISIGDALELPISRILGFITPLIGKITDWIKENPKLAATIGMVTVAVMGLVLAGSLLATFVIPAITTAIELLGGQVAAVVLGITALTAGFGAVKLSADKSAVSVEALAKAKAVLADETTSVSDKISAQTVILQEESNAAKMAVESAKASIEATKKQIEAINQLVPEYVNLKNQLDNSKLSEEEAAVVKVKMAERSRDLQAVLGEERAEKILNAENTREAAKIELDALETKLREETKTYNAAIENQRRVTNIQIVNVDARIRALEKEARAYSIWGKFLEWQLGIGLRVSEAALRGTQKAYEVLKETPLEESAHQALTYVNEIVWGYREALDNLHTEERASEFDRLSGELDKLLNRAERLSTVSSPKIDTSGITDASKKTEKIKDDALRKELAAFDHKVRMGELTKEQQLADLERIKNLAKTEEGRWGVEERIKALKDSMFKDEMAAFDRRARMGELTKEQQLAELGRLKELAQTEEDRIDTLEKTRSVKESIYRRAIEMMDHEISMNRLSLDQQIALLEKFRKAHEWSTQQKWDLEGRLARLYSEKLKAAADEVEKTFQNQADAIDRATEETIDGIQSKIDALDARLKALDEERAQDEREDTREAHEKRLGELYEKRLYHEQRTGQEHTKAIAEIDKQIAEENRSWAEKQEDWQRDERRRQIEADKEAYREQIKQVRDAAEEKKKELRNYYDEVKKITDKGLLDTIASMAAKNSGFLKKGYDIIDAIKKGMESGDLPGYLAGLQQQITAFQQTYITPTQRGAETGVSEAGMMPVVTVAPGQYSLINDVAVMLARDLAAALGASVDWDDATKQVVIGGWRFSPVRIVNDRAYVSIREVAETLGHEVKWDAATRNIMIYHEGGQVPKDTLAYLQKGEFVVPREAAKTLPGMVDLSVAIDRAADRIVDAINRRMGMKIDRLLHIERYEPEDELDVRALTRQLESAVYSLVRAGG